MTRTGAALLVESMAHYGVEHLFGNPGTTELPIMHALEDAPLEYVLGLHEDIAVGMAAGYARARTYHAHDDPSVLPVGVVNLHVMGGLAHGLGNCYNALRGNVPLVVTAGDHRTDSRHKEPVLSGDLARLAAPVTKWSADVPDVDALPLLVRRAFRTALSPPMGPVFLGLPLDVTMAPTDAPVEPLGAIPTAGAGDPASVARAAELVDAADSIGLVVGAELARAGPDAVSAAVSFAERTGAAVMGEILAAEIPFPTDHDRWAGFISPNAAGARSALEPLDLAVFAGCSMSNTPITGTEERFVPRGTTVVQLGADPGQLGKNDPADAAILGDAGRVLSALADAVGSRPEGDWTTAHVESRHFGGDRADDAPDDPMSKATLADVLCSTVGEAFFVDEALTATQFLLDRGRFGPGEWMKTPAASLGFGLPATVGAALAESKREAPTPVVGFIGDGSYLYYPQTVYTAARYGIDCTVVVPDNRNYRILKENMLSIMGGAEADYEFIGMDLEPPVDIPANARSHGADAELVTSVEGLESALESARTTAGPTVLDVPVHD